METRSTEPSPLSLPSDTVLEDQPVPTVVVTDQILTCPGERAPIAPTAPAPWLHIPSRNNSSYFFNFVTRESTWANPTAWTCYFCPQCNIHHHYNSETQEITFTNPLTPPEPENFVAPAAEVSPFSSKLGTNYSPSDEEVVEIRNHLADPLSKMMILHSRINELQYGEGNLYQQLHAIHTYVEAHTALLAPVRRLPRDIIQEIFVACLPENRNCVMSAQEAPVLLGRVCSSWRTISLSTPRLWARLHIAEPTLPWQRSASTLLLYAEKHAQRVETTKAWLGRSGECPLSCSFESRSEEGEAPVDAPTTRIFFQVLVLFAHRWQHIRLVAPFLDLELLSSLKGNDVPMLESLEIHELRQSSPHNTPWESFGLLGGPKMSGFALYGISPTFTLPLRWESLTSLTFVDWGPSNRLTSHKALEILRKSPRLRVCHLRIEEEVGVSPPALGEYGTTLELSDLHSLRISCNEPWIFIDRGLFSHLNLPELRNLRVDVGWSHAIPANIYVYVFPFLTVSPQLEDLEIGAQGFSKQQLVDLLSALPSTIQQLRLSDSTNSFSAEHIFDDNTIAALTPAPDRPVDCPNLVVLVINRCVVVSDEALLRFITARMAAQPATLQHVKIHFCRPRQLNICANIQPFLDSGLEVALKYDEDRPVNLSPWRGVELA
ncbi:hypothetical protein C8F04DRAFT_1101292 [Mycena alexandri]|uniref:WW domain-containing protein n=1 Tax=Mycena alexandri TaxID=1745969 RepID=A0AAD6SUY7_9AGAR|nr:hypothetical protein C8F04DRAFT_1101292 [Mycena alexandri]